MPKRLTLTEQFDNPGIRVGLDILLIHARTLDESLSGAGKADLFDRSEEGSWLEVIEQLGRLQADPNSRVADKNKIDDLWAAFFALNPIKNLYEPELISVLQECRKKSVVYAKGAGDPLVYMERANDEGQVIARKILADCKLEKQLAAKPVGVQIFYDEPGEHYCAGTNSETKTIYWAFQAVPHGLAGVIMAERILAHEYLSHLAPKNSLLDLTIREQWLVSALKAALEADASKPYWKNRLWSPYHEDLQSHAVEVAKKLKPASATPRRFSGYPGVLPITDALYYKEQALSHALTAEILGQKESQELADLASEVARGLAGQGISQLDLSNIKNLTGLAELLRKRGL
jgi:hypothetical protein